MSKSRLGVCRRNLWQPGRSRPDEQDGFCLRRTFHQWSYLGHSAPILAAGYSLHFIFLGLQDTALSELRVIDRSRIGGHYVDPLTIADNFYGNLEKLDQHFGIFHSVHIIDTSEAEHLVLAMLSHGKPSIAVPPDMLPNWFVRYLPLITQKIRDDGLKFL